MIDWVRHIAGSRSFRVVVVLVTIFVVLYSLPVPPVGEPVESLALESSKFVVVEGVKVHYVEVLGSGNLTFVLLHGFGASTFSWRSVVSGLARYGRVVAFDRPGFGLTERVDPHSLSFNPYTTEGQMRLTLELIRKLNASNVVLVGHSAGGGLALLTALENPQLVKALVLVAPAWREVRKNPLAGVLYSIPLADKYGPLLVRILVGQLEQVLYRAWYNKSALTKEVIEGYKYPLRARDWDKGLYWLTKYSGFPDISNSLRNLEVPVLIVHGANDELVPLISSLELVKLLSSNTRYALSVVSECGHLPHEEKPWEFLEVVSKFIEDLT